MDDSNHNEHGRMTVVEPPLAPSLQAFEGSLETEGTGSDYSPPAQAIGVLSRAGVVEPITFIAHTACLQRGPG